MYDIYFNNFFAGLDFEDAIDSLENDYGKTVVVLDENQKINDYHVSPLFDFAVVEGVNGSTYLMLTASNGRVLQSQLRHW